MDKSYARKPPALGMTIGESGCAFDLNPPSEPELNRGGRPTVRLDECKRWLAERLVAGGSRVKDIRTDAEGAGFSADLLYRSHDALGVEEYVIEGRKWWRLTSVGLSETSGP